MWKMSFILIQSLIHSTNEFSAAWFSIWITVKHGGLYGKWLKWKNKDSYVYEFVTSFKTNSQDSVNNFIIIIWHYDKHIHSLIIEKVGIKKIYLKC